MYVKLYMLLKGTTYSMYQKEISIISYCIIITIPASSLKFPYLPTMQHKKLCYACTFCALLMYVQQLLQYHFHVHVFTPVSITIVNDECRAIPYEINTRILFKPSSVKFINVIEIKKFHPLYLNGKIFFT